MSRTICIILVIAELLLMACSEASKELSIYQDKHALVFQWENDEQVLLSDVIDYSYDTKSDLLFVLHEERSEQTDMIGYNKALEEGLTIGGYIRVYEIDRSDHQIALEQVYENDFTWVNPWSLASGQLSHDGGVDLFVACYRATEFYDADRRPFIVTWDGEKIIKRWTGSYIGNDSFLTGDFEDGDEDGLDELVLTVKRRDGRTVKRTYTWQTFTFDYVNETIINGY